MTIEQYIREQGITLPVFAQRIGVPYQTLYAVHRRPWMIIHADLAKQIIDGSEGKISLEDLVRVNRYKGRGGRSRRAVPKIPESPAAGSIDSQ